jgi:hypothetical protein
MDWLGAGIVFTALWLFASPFELRKKAVKESLITATVLGRQTMIYTPKGADGSKIIVYFHGHNDLITVRVPKLVESLRKTGKNPILIVPQLQGKSEPGDLVTKFNQWLVESRKYLEFNSGNSEIVIVSHSGGYRATASAINQVNYISSVALLDSLYGNVDDFYHYILRSATQHFLDYYTVAGGTKANSLNLLKRVVGRKNVFFQQIDFIHDEIPQKILNQVVDLIF